MRLIELFANNLPSLEEASVPLTQEEINSIKAKWEEGKKPQEIADNLGLDVRKVNEILYRYHRDRANKYNYYVRALTDEDKDQIISAFRDGTDTSEIARRFGLGGPSSVKRVLVALIGEREYEDAMTHRRSNPGTINRKITPEMLERFIDMYRKGRTTEQISDHFDNVVTKTPIYNKLRDQPNWEEIKADHAKNSKRRGRNQATTKTTPAGEIGNLQSKGRGSKHFHGQYPSKQY